MLTTTILAWPTLSGEEKALVAAGQDIKAIKAYRERVRLTLLNGHEACPTLMTGRDMVKAFRTGLGDFEMAISEGSYTDLTEQAAQRAIINERFAMFCAEDGIDPKNPRLPGARHSCDNCNKVAAKGETLEGTDCYSPDAMGYPTVTFFYCNDCTL